MTQFATPMLQTAEKIRVLAADSSRMSSQLLAQALAQNTEFHVTGIDPKPASILAAVADEKPNVVLMSSVLDEYTTGFDLIRQVCAMRPETRVVMLMDTSKRSAVVEAFRSGAHGVFSRTESPKLLAKCVCSVHQGQVWANSAELRYLLQALCESEPPSCGEVGRIAILSKREQDVVRCVAQGFSNREIGKKLGLTEHTVKNYLFRIFDKLGVSSRVEVVLYAFRFRNDLIRSKAPADNVSPEGNKSRFDLQLARARKSSPTAMTKNNLAFSLQTQRRARA
jgi:two-component system, NarL family, nitrate/nitrite response regulator NarL